MKLTLAMLWSVVMFCLGFASNRSGDIENNAVQTVNVGHQTDADKLRGVASANGREWLTVAEYARVLGIDRDTVYARIQRGEIEASKEGQAWRIPLAENLQETGKR